MKDQKELSKSTNQQQVTLDNQEFPKAKSRIDTLKPQNAFAGEIAEGVSLNIWPQTRLTWSQFCEISSNSIAIDGFVVGPPIYNHNGPHRNFNHHEGVDRDCTRSTAGQVHMGLKRSLVKRFQKDGVFKANVFVEDADQDVCMSCWLLANHERICGEHSEPLINRLLYMLDIQDSAAGMYPYDPSSKIMRQMKWIFDPYIEARLSNSLYQMSGSQMFNLIQTVMKNITQYTLVDCGTKKLDTEFEIIGGGTGWSMTIEHGYEARSAYSHRGIEAFVSVMEQADGSFVYSIGRSSAYIDFPVLEIIEHLNKHEKTACWGGSDVIGGSRGGEGSSLPPKEVEKLVNKFLVNYLFKL